MKTSPSTKRSNPGNSVDIVRQAPICVTDTRTRDLKALARSTYKIFTALSLLVYLCIITVHFLDLFLPVPMFLTKGIATKSLAVRVGSALSINDKAEKFWKVTALLRRKKN